ncbi:MAG TPA: 2OG-Fe(II) oxygenase [Polyangiaceae bacterium]|nr:2OG-Fe(II) oxygenase [Polyangiaceae bacterium]
MALQSAPAPSSALELRLRALDWATATRELDERGHAVLPSLLAAAECAELRSLYAEAAPFRSTVVMARHRYGSGEYKYFSYPLPALVGGLRASLYRELAPIANRWNSSLGIETSYPAEHAEFVARCHAAGQARPTPLLLRYEAGDYNCLHRDLYGEHVFPLQVAILLSQPAADFEGGEFVLTEQRPRRQSRVEVVPLARGDAVVFAVQHRPVAGQRGMSRAQLRHGVSRLRAGQRYTLGVIFHDAE